MLEAWSYAWNNDTARISGDETPWLDDDGDGKPTYINEVDFLDDDDGNLAANTALPSCHLTVRTFDIVHGEFDGAKVWIDDYLAGTSPVVDLQVTANCTIKVEDPFHEGDYRYEFDEWEDGSTDNPRNITITNDTTVEAYYYKMGGGGGCPYVYIWDGYEYVLDNNLLPTSLANNGTDVEDYYKLEQSLVPRFESKWYSCYSLQIREFQNEHSYLDQTKLIAVKHDSDVNIAITPDGEVLTYRGMYSPISCVDNNGTDRLSEILLMDGNVSDPTTFFYGDAGDYLVLNFSHITSKDAKLIIRDDMICKLCCMDVQVLGSDCQWKTVAVVAPRDYWSIEAVNLSSYVVTGQDFMVRLVWTSPHRLDYVGLDVTQQDDFEMHNAKMVLAIHSTYGDVRAELSENDGIYTELIPGEQIELLFRLPNSQRDKRTFILYTEGRYYAIT